MSSINTPLIDRETIKKRNTKSQSKRDQANVFYSTLNQSNNQSNNNNNTLNPDKMKSKYLWAGGAA